MFDLHKSAKRTQSLIQMEVGLYRFLLLQNRHTVHPVHNRFLLLDNCSCIVLISYIHVTMQNRHTTAMEGGSADYAGAVINPPHPVHKSRHLQRFCAAEETVQETLARHVLHVENPCGFGCCTGFLLSRLCKKPIFVIPAKETVQETQRSSFLTPLAPLIRGELSGKSP